MMTSMMGVSHQSVEIDKQARATAYCKPLGNAAELKFS